MAWMLGKDGKMIFVEPGTPVYGEIPAPLAMNIVNPQDGQALVYDGTKGEWVNGEGGGGGSFDPTITNPQDGQAVVYDGTAGKWKNGAVDVGWSAGEQQLFSETVTTQRDSSLAPTDEYPFAMADLEYSTSINYDSIKVIFENQEYTCPQIDIGGRQVAYGGVSQQGPDFSEYPFAILSSLTGDGNILYTQTEGTYTVAVRASGITVTENFKTAVANSMIVPEYTIGIGEITCDFSYAEVLDAVSKGVCTQAKVTQDGCTIYYRLNAVEPYAVTFTHTEIDTERIVLTTILYTTSGITIQNIEYNSSPSSN